MPKIKSLIIIFIAFLLCLSNFFSVSLASYVEVNKDNLEKAFSDLMSSNTTETTPNIEFSDEYITITSDSENYQLNYDISENPIFSIDLPVEQGMSYEDFDLVSSNIILPILGYIAVSSIQGVDYEDSSTYFLETVLSSNFSASSKYVIVDDSDPNSVIVPDLSDGQEIIYTSDFGNHVMEYVNSIFEGVTNIDDSENLNTFTLSMEQKDVSDTSCTIVSTLTVNLDSDFSKLVGYADSQDKPSDGEESQNNENSFNEVANEVTNENSSTVSDENKISSNIVKQDNSITNSNLPKSGIGISFYVIFTFIIGLTIIFGLKFKYFKDI